MAFDIMWCDVNEDQIVIQYQDVGKSVDPNDLENKEFLKLKVEGSDRNWHDKEKPQYDPKKFQLRINLESKVQGKSYSLTQNLPKPNKPLSHSGNVGEIADNVISATSSQQSDTSTARATGATPPDIEGVESEIDEYIGTLDTLKTGLDETIAEKLAHPDAEGLKKQAEEISDSLKQEVTWLQDQKKILSPDNVELILEHIHRRFTEQIIEPNVIRLGWLAESAEMFKDKTEESSSVEEFEEIIKEFEKRKKDFDDELKKLENSPTYGKGEKVS